MDTTFFDLTAQLIDKNRELTTAMTLNKLQQDIQVIYEDIAAIHEELCYIKQRRMAS